MEHEPERGMLDYPIRGEPVMNVALMAAAVMAAFLLARYAYFYWVASEIAFK